MVKRGRCVVDRIYAINLIVTAIGWRPEAKIHQTALQEILAFDVRLIIPVENT